MEKKRDHSFIDDMELPQPDAADLRGRQSVRATFKLSARAIEALSIVAVHLGIKQKSLFDHLIEDVQTLNAIAKEMEAEEFRSLSRIQKTFVISRRTLVCLDEISRQFRPHGMPWWSIRSSGCFRSSTANARNIGGARSCSPKSISISRKA